jgi:predicted flap endonuclease-1-like 5' DNA nuclease
LLEQAGNPSGRQALAERSGIDQGLILKWVNHADLYRITGIGSEYSDLLEASGVDSVLELAHRNGANLTEKLGEVNESRHLVRRTPTQAEVEGWIEEAKTLPRAVMH